jgi:hypothetical protein
MTWPDKAIVCSADCDLCYIADWNEDGSPKRIDCAKEWMVGGVPGHECPVYGGKAKTITLRLIDEVAIDELWDEWVDCLEGQDKEQVTMILTAAGLGKGETK